MDTDRFLTPAVIEAIRLGFEYPHAGTPTSQPFFPRGPWGDQSFEVRRQVLLPEGRRELAEDIYLLPYPTVLRWQDMQAQTGPEQRLKEALARIRLLETENAHLHGLLNGTIGAGPGGLSPTILKR